MNIGIVDGSGLSIGFTNTSKEFEKDSFEGLFYSACPASPLHFNRTKYSIDGLLTSANFQNFMMVIILVLSASFEKYGQCSPFLNI